MKTGKSKSIIVAASVMVTLIVVVVIIGFMIPEQREIIQGEAETTDYRVSSKIPSRVLEFRVAEGDMVRRGDTLVIMEAPDIAAKLDQAAAARSAAEAMEEKARNGSRAEELQGAFELWQKAIAGLDVAEKTYNRINRLFENGVMAEQKRDEAKANYDAMAAAEKAARAQYEMARNGARHEDKAAAEAQVRRAQGAVSEVESYVRETVITAPDDGEVTEIFPEVGELVGTGAPIMNIAKTDDVWFTFNVREDRLVGLTVGSVHEAYVPSVDRRIKVRITRLKNVGDFAAWKATKALEGFDLKVFEVKAVPLDTLKGVKSGMSVMLQD